MNIYEPKELTVNNFSFSCRFDKYSRQLTDIGGDGISFGCDDEDIFQDRNNGIHSFGFAINNQTSTEPTVERSLSRSDKYSRQLTDIGGDGISFGCDNS